MRAIALLTALLVLTCFSMVSASSQVPGNQSLATTEAQRLFYDSFDNGSLNWNIDGYATVNENHNTFLSGEGTDNNHVQLVRQLIATNFTLKAKFRLNVFDKNICFEYRYYLRAGSNGYFLNIKKISDQGEYLASLEKDLEGTNTRYGSRSIFLNDRTPGTWHQVAIDGEGGSINVCLDGESLFSIVDDQNPILGGSVYFTSDRQSNNDIDDIELWAAPEDVYMPASVTQPDWSFLGVTLLKGTFSQDNTYVIVDFFPAARASLTGNVFLYTLFGVEVGGWGLAFTIFAYVVVIVAAMIGIAELIYRLARRTFKRMNRSVNRTVIKSKARIYRARAKSATSEGAGAGDAGPVKTIVNDVFISYSPNDKQVADLITANLESKKIKCWLAPRDVPAGDNYQAALIEAIDASSMMVLIFSASSNNSPNVIREITRAVSQGLILIPFRIENVPLSKSMEYLISVPHWMEATEPPMDDNIDRLAARVRSIMKGENPGDERTNK